MPILRTSAEDLAASIATAGELSVIAVTAVDLVHLAAELFVHQGHSASVAEEAGLVPMLILVRQILQNETPITIARYVPRFSLVYLANMTACRAIKSTRESLSRKSFSREGSVLYLCGYSNFFPPHNLTLFIWGFFRVCNRGCWI